MKKIILFLCITTVINVFADNSKPNDNVKYPFNYGRMEDTIYTNPFFGFKIAIPSTWTVQNKTQIDYILSKGKDVLNFDSDVMNKAIEKIDINSMTLLLVYKYEAGTPVKYNPSIIIMAENILLQPGIKHGSDYLFHVSNGLMKSNLNFDCTAAETAMFIDKHELYKINCTIIDGIVQQNYFTTIINRYAFSFIISFSDEEEKNELLSIINSSEFK